VQIAPIKCKRAQDISKSSSASVILRQNMLNMKRKAVGNHPGAARIFSQTMSRHGRKHDLSCSDHAWLRLTDGFPAEKGKQNYWRAHNRLSARSTSLSAPQSILCASSSIRAWISGSARIVRIASALSGKLIPKVVEFHDQMRLSRIVTCTVSR